MKVIAVCGSPRKGNTEWMLSQLQKNLEVAGVEVELLLLRKLNIRKCAGCLKCEDRKGLCYQQDDINDILPRLLAADVIVLGTPVYMEMLSGLLKNFLDRTCPIWTQLKGKPLAGVAVAEGGIGQAVRNIKTYSALCEMKWIGSVTTLAKKPGDTAKDKNLARRLKRLAKKIVKSQG
jgi:multimeric flavodoxin WrbA